MGKLYSTFRQKTVSTLAYCQTANFYFAVEPSCKESYDLERAL